MAGPWEEYGGKTETGPWNDAPATPKKDKSFLEYLANDFTGLANNNTRGSVIGGWMQGMADPVVGAVQLAANAIGQGDGVNKAIANKEQEYQGARKLADRDGVDASRIAGNVTMTLPAASVGAPAQGASLLARIGSGAAQGGAMAALNPVVNGGDNFWSDKAKEVGTGALAGGVAAPVVGALARIVSPNASTNAELQMLRESGVNPTIGQALGGAAKITEEKAMSLPVLGDMIRNARKGADAEFRQAAYGRALDPIGQTVSGTGRDAVGEIGQKIGQEYDRVLPQLMADVTDPAFVQRLSNIRQGVQTLPKDLRDFYDGVISREIDQRIAPNGMLSADNLKDAWRSLRDTGGKLANSQDPFQSQLGGAIKQTLEELKQHVSNTNPQAAVDALKNADKAYANFKRIQKAASALGAEGGEFSPAQLQNAVKAADKSKDKAAFARGDALMQDLSEAGKNVLATKYPDSGTAGRGLLAALLGGGAYATGALGPVLAGATVGAGAYTKPVQNLLVKLVADRPDLAPRVAEMIRGISPYASTAAGVSAGR